TFNPNRNLGAMKGRISRAIRSAMLIRGHRRIRTNPRRTSRLRAAVRTGLEKGDRNMKGGRGNASERNDQSPLYRQELPHRNRFRLMTSLLAHSIMWSAAMNRFR